MALEFDDYTRMFHKNGKNAVLFEVSEYTSGDYPRYYGYITTDGAWFIQEQSVDGNVMSMRYAAGKDSYETNWTNRASLSYVLYSAIRP